MENKKTYCPIQITLKMRLKDIVTASTPSVGDYDPFENDIYFQQEQ